MEDARHDNGSVLNPVPRLTRGELESADWRWQVPCHTLLDVPAKFRHQVASWPLVCEARAVELESGVILAHPAHRHIWDMDFALLKTMSYEVTFQPSTGKCELAKNLRKPFRGGQHA
eukprot:3101631-Pleurochrysis_carterae.AAC.1